MQFKSITVSLSLSQKLPNGCTVNPAMSLTAEIHPDDILETIISSVERKVRPHVESYIDDALEAANESPKYYEGPLYNLWHWEQHDALVILSPTAPIMLLPGDWVRHSQNPMRFNTIFDRAHAIAAHNHEITEILELPTTDDLLTWWDTQSWYIACGLLEWDSQFSCRVAQVLFIPIALTRPEGLASISPTPRTLASYTSRHFPVDDSVPWTAIESQEQLNLLAANWVEEHPKPKSSCSLLYSTNTDQPSSTSPPF